MSRRNRPDRRPSAHWLDLTKRLAGLILTQILPFCDATVLRLFEQFESAIYADRAA